MNAYLFKTEKSTKIVVVAQDENDLEHLFDIDSNLMFNSLLDKDRITFIEKFQLSGITKSKTGLINVDSVVKVNTLLTLQPDILFMESITNELLINFNGHSCILLNYANYKDINRYFNILLLIDQFLSIQNKLRLQ